MGHGAFILHGEFTELYESDGDGYFGAVMDYVAKGWMDGSEVMLTMLNQFERLPDLTAVERCYAHIGRDGSVFYHNEPGPGRFPVTHVYRDKTKNPWWN